MPLLIDGHNLIGQMDEISLADPDDEERLINLLAEYQRRRRTQITVVFDSGVGGVPQPTEQRQGGIRVVYARAGQPADDVICRLVRQAHQRSDWVVVTSDRLVQSEVRHLGATVIPANEFARRLAPPSRHQTPNHKEQPPSPQEVEAWLKLFSQRKGKRQPR